jgi:hypothetical protein
VQCQCVDSLILLVHVHFLLVSNLFIVYFSATRFYAHSYQHIMAFGIRILDMLPCPPFII